MKSSASTCLRPRSGPGQFPSFNAFFTRALKPDARPLVRTLPTLPVGQRRQPAGRHRANQVFQAKGHDYSLYDLVGGDSALASEFTDGQFATIYLSPRTTIAYTCPSLAPCAKHAMCPATCSP